MRVGVRHFIASLAVLGSLAAPLRAGGSSQIANVLTFPAGTNGRIQFNSSGFWGADTDLWYDTATDRLHVKGLIFAGDSSEQTSAASGVGSSSVTAAMYIGDVTKSTFNATSPTPLSLLAVEGRPFLRVFDAKTSLTPPAVSRMEYWIRDDEFGGTSFVKTGSWGWNGIGATGLGIYDASDNLKLILTTTGRLGLGAGAGSSGFANPPNTLEVGGSFGVSVTSRTATTTVNILAEDEKFIYEIWATSGTVVVTLPNLSNSGEPGTQLWDRWIKICKADSSTNTVTFFTNPVPGTDHFDPLGLSALTQQGECVDLMGEVQNLSDSGNLQIGYGIWHEIGHSLIAYSTATGTGSGNFVNPSTVPLNMGGFNITSIGTAFAANLSATGYLTVLGSGSVAGLFTVGGSTLGVNGISYFFPAVLPAAGTQALWLLDSSGNISTSAVVTNGITTTSTETKSGALTLSSPSGLSVTYGLSAGTETLTGVSTGTLLYLNTSHVVSTVTLAGSGVTFLNGILTITAGGGSGDMILASTQTVTGGKTFTSSITAQGALVDSAGSHGASSGGVNGIQVLTSTSPSIAPLWQTIGVVVSTQGSTTVNGVNVCQMTASAGTHFINWSLMASQASAASTTMTITVKYSDGTTTSVSSGATSNSWIFGNAGSLIRWSSSSGFIDVTAGSAKPVTQLTIASNGGGTGARGGTISAEQVPL